jgi:tripeptide aminopeptidase
MKTIVSAFLACFLTAGLALGQASDSTITANVVSLLGNARFKSAQDFIANDHDRIIRETISLTEIEAPPFKEAARGRAYAQMFREHGLTNVAIDAEGNVTGIRKGVGAGPLIAIAAHLDTVFPPGTDVKVKRQGTRLMAPGIGDNSRSLAVLLGIIRAMNDAGIATASDILFVGNVGEEGPGDLRGMRYLFQKGPYKDKIKMFISVDGPGDGGDIVNGALGSKRYRVTFKGPGGHSYASFGLVNPAYALAKAINRFSSMQVPSSPSTTFNVGVIGGGTSVNSIPFEAWMEVDLRSESVEELNKVANTFSAHMRAAVDEENRARSTTQGVITLDLQLMGDRPSGATPISSSLVQTAAAVARAFMLAPRYSIASTDANIPISLNIPAVTLGSGGFGSRAHALDEWIDVEKTASVRGIQVLMATLLTLAGAR